MTTPTTCSGCGRSLAPSEALYTADAQPVCTPCFERADLAASTRRAGRRLPGAALAFAAAPFLLSFTQTSITTAGGVSHVVVRDYVAIGGGAVGLTLAIVAIVQNRRAGLSIGLALAAIGLAAVQLARGFGAFA
jgi:hypothetical protein